VCPSMRVRGYLESPGNTILMNGSGVRHRDAHRSGARPVPMAICPKPYVLDGDIVQLGLERLACNLYSWQALNHNPGAKEQPMCANPSRRVARALFFAANLLLLTHFLAAQQIAPPNPGGESLSTTTQFTTAVDVPARQQWTDSGILLEAGDRVRIVATGSVRRPAA